MNVSVSLTRNFNMSYITILFLQPHQVGTTVCILQVETYKYRRLQHLSKVMCLGFSHLEPHLTSLIQILCFVLHTLSSCLWFIIFPQVTCKDYQKEQMITQEVLHKRFSL